MKKQAYKNVNNLKLIDETKLNFLTLAACLEKATQSGSPDQGLQHMDISTAQGICNGIIFGYISHARDSLLYSSLSTFT